MQTLKCVICGTQMPENTSGRKRKYCSSSCTSRSRGAMPRPEVMHCLVCGDNIPNTKKYCSKACLNVKRRETSKKIRKKNSFARCFSCLTYIPNDDRKVPCCNDAQCRQDWWRRNPPLPVPEDWVA